MSWVKFQQQDTPENRFTNFQPITPNQYADNMESAIGEYLKISSIVPQYEKDLAKFLDRAVKAFTVNRIRLQEIGLSKFERSARIKANHKIRNMIRVGDKELKKTEQQRIDKLALDVSEKFKVNLFTLKKLL